MAADMFLKLDGIQGESQDKTHKNEIELLTYQFGVHQQGTMVAGTGGGAGKATFEDLHFTKRVDKSSPNLFVAAASGSHIATAIVTVRKAGGDQVEYLKITMNDVIISSFNSSGHEGDVPLESITFNFTKVKKEYSPQNPDGTLGGVITGGYDVKANQKI